MNAVALDGTATKALSPRAASYLSGWEAGTYGTLDVQQKNDWLSGRLALKIAALRHLESREDLDSLVIKNLPSGAPYIIGQGELFCSIAHSNAWGIAAISSDQIGVDIERIRPHAEGLLEYLADDEEIVLFREMFKNSSDIITAIWTIKEAVLKGLGIGFGISPKKLKVSFSENEALFRVEVQNQDSVSPWWVKLEKKEDFFISIASPKIHEQQDVNWYNPVSV